MLWNYLLQNFDVGEPILLADIKINGMTETNLRQSFKVLTDSGKLRRYDSGIYYMPPVSRLKGGAMLSTEKVIERKYLSRKCDVYGYYTGYTFANMLGITTQVPTVRELASNNTSANRREVELGGRKLILRKPRTEINSSNALTLQFLDLMKDLDRYSELSHEELSARIQKYVIQQRISKQEIDRYLPIFPEKIYKSIYETELYNVLA